jgi:hypothetical protein
MRTREEIEDGQIVGGYQIDNINDRLLEVLLDIRDLLANPLMQGDEAGNISGISQEKVATDIKQTYQR